MQDIQHYMRPGTLQLPSLPPLSLYVHLPWCLKKCPYCDFNSHELTPKTLAASAPRGGVLGLGRPGAELKLAPKTPAASAPRGGVFGLGRPGAELNPQDVPEQRYLDALVADLEASLPLIWGRQVQSIFIGGGTPSLFSPPGINRLLSDIRARLKLAADCEITLEANPGTFEKERFRAFRDAGVTRLSVGVQSFNDAHLKALGRVHDRAQALAALEEAAHSFETWNLDLMYALPGQDLAQLDADLDAALSFAPPHLSVYHLTIEPNTYFAKFPPQTPDEDTAYAMLDRITERTAVMGLQRYEVSAYAKPGHGCQHNLNYWQFGDYLGIGAGAHGKLSFAHRVIRQVRARDPRLYMEKALSGNAGDAVVQEEEVSRADLPFEFMLNALRLKDGFALQDFSERTGLALTAIRAALEEAERKGWLTRTLVRAQPTAQGFDFLSDLQALFLP